MIRRSHTKSPIWALGCALALAAPASAGAADAAQGPARGPAGQLRALGADGAPAGDCPLLGTEVEAEISGFVARVRVTQLFRNPSDSPIEAVYSFPLSERGAVDAMSIRSGERSVHGEIRRREHARRIYEEVRDAGKLAALLDEERPNVFTQTVGNLLPGARVEVRIEYVEMLEFEAGTFEFSFPTVVGPRFVPDDGRVRDAVRIAPPLEPEGARAGHDFAIRVSIDAGLAIEAIDSPLHEVAIERRAPHLAEVSLADGALAPDRDFVVRFRVAGRAVKNGWLAHRAGDGPGYLSLVLMPPLRVTREQAAPKALVFVVDRSGSQSGLPLAKAKETLLWILDHMSPATRTRTRTWLRAIEPG